MAQALMVASLRWRRNSANLATVLRLKNQALHFSTDGGIMICIGRGGDDAHGTCNPSRQPVRRHRSVWRVAFMTVGLVGERAPGWARRS